MSGPNAADTPHLGRDELAERYLAQLPFPPYQVQEDALLAWFTAPQGVLVCAPTGTGKTLIAEAALFEALHTRKVAYYTTPLVALTEQKFQEMQAAAVRWGFSAGDVGLVTGNRRVNPQATVLMVVAEILLNRLLQHEAFDFHNVAAVVMDEFHNFAEPQRGYVWELALGLLPKHVRLLLLSATVGNAFEFRQWLQAAHGRTVELVQGTERRVPLTYHWVEDQLLNELLTEMAAGEAAVRRTPALVFCFNREECWSVAEQLKGCPLVVEPQRTQLLAAVNELDLAAGVGPKLKQLLQRGVGVHHAGMLPRYRRVVEELFQQKLLSVAVCTETLAAGINLPARSVVLSSLVKGPPGKQVLLDPSTAHQIFGRAGRPQYDTQGHVYALAHEDDVRILRWKEKYDAIPETTKDPNLLKAKKALKKKKPTRRENQAYWTQAQFAKLQSSPPAKLFSRSALPWRLLAYWLSLSSDLGPIRDLVGRRLMDAPRIKAGQAALDEMLLTLHEAGYVTLDPPPPPPPTAEEAAQKPAPPKRSFLEQVLAAERKPDAPVTPPPAAPKYQARRAAPTERLGRLLLFRSVNPLYGAFLLEHLGLANEAERLQIFESVLGLPGPLLRYVRVPMDLPPGPLETTRLDPLLVQRGLIAAPKDADADDEEPTYDDGLPPERPPRLADKVRLLFDAELPNIPDVQTQALWCAGELLLEGGRFETYVRARDLTKQEGLIFRHLLRLILLCEEFQAAAPAELPPDEWQAFLRGVAGRLTELCREVDPASTDETLRAAHAADEIEGESHAQAGDNPSPAG